MPGRSSGGLEWYIARHYLSSASGGRLLSFITWIALGGVTVGVSALVIVIGVMSGMQEDLMGKILESSPHVLVQKQGRSLRMDDWQEVTAAVREVEGVTGVAPLVLTSVAVSRAGYTQPADLYGVSLGSEGPPVTEMEARIQEGIHDLGPTASGLPPVVLGSRLAARMSVFSGDTLTVISFENIIVDFMGMPTPSLRQYEMTGTFTTGMYDYDLKNIYVPLEAAQDQLDILEGDRISMLGVRTDDPDQATVVAQAIQENLGFEFYAVSWSTTNRALFSALKLEKLAMGLILILIVVVAAFNIVSTLVMVVVDRTREIGILKSHGHDRPDDPSYLRHSGPLDRRHRYGHRDGARPLRSLGDGHVRDHPDSARRLLRGSAPFLHPCDGHLHDRGHQRPHRSHSHDLPGDSGLTAPACGRDPA